MADKKNLLGLLKSTDEFVVPTIQRDYAQGRDKGSNKDLCEDVRTGLIKSLYDALINDEFLLLDYIYGTNDSNVFYPIDGQQRLTTLFLLHWYIGKKERINETGASEFDLLRRFSYEIRDTSKEFCKSLIDIDVIFDKDTISNQIKDSSKYHDAYGFDPTVSSMLIVIDTIHNQFKEVNMPLWDRLKKIEFWCLSLEHFGLTDDLFVKMNARGKRLSRFDVFKSDLESNLESKIEKIEHKDGEIWKTWKTEIDNAYLDAYWKMFRFELSERNLFRTILFYVKGLISAKNISTRYDDLWEIDESNVNYNDVINHVADPDSDALTRICHLLSNFDAWKKYVDDTGLFVKSGSTEQNNILGYNKVIIFGILYWFSFDDKMLADRNFMEFKRILENYVFSLRQPNIRPTKRFYSSSIDNSNVGRAFCFLKKVIDGYSRTVSFNEYVLESDFTEFDYEKEKLSYSSLADNEKEKLSDSSLEDNEKEKSSLEDIIDLENVSFLKRNITNFFFDGKLYLKESVVKSIAKDEDLINKSLRIIYSYADDRYGKFQDLLMDKTLIMSGHKQLYYKDSNDQATAYMHKLSFNADDTDTCAFGDRILTASGDGIYKDISDCVRKFASELSQKLNPFQPNVSDANVSDAVNELLSERIAHSNFADSLNIKWYIVKYEEFFYSKTSTTLSVLRRKNYGGIDDDNVYDMQCLSDDNDFSGKEHYHPFYQALSNKLNNRVTISTPLRYTGVQIEYAHPCTLSNGWIIQINKDGNWFIDFKESIPTLPIARLTINSSGLGELDCSGNDSISMMAAFINAL